MFIIILYRERFKFKYGILCPTLDIWKKIGRDTFYFKFGRNYHKIPKISRGLSIIIGEFMEKNIIFLLLINIQINPML